MALDSEILADFQQLLSEHGAAARWGSLDLRVLVSRARRDQQIDIGGMVDAPELTLRVARQSFTGSLPATGDRIEVEGAVYRISQASSHPRSPILSFTLSTTDE